MGKYTKQEKSWMMYDWANSAYSIIITTAIFPIYYKAVAENAEVSVANSTAYLGYTISIATFILAMLGPILGTIADYKGMKKKFFLFFFLVGTISTFSLLFVPADNWLLLLIVYTVTAIGARGANIFYDAHIVDVTKKERMDDVSAKGYALGYIGSVIPFVICIAIIFLAQSGTVPFTETTASRIAFVITALWWIAFSIPLIKNVKQKHGVDPEPRVVVNSFKRLGKTFKEIKKYRNIFLFLIAYFFYIDGVGTIISMSTAYGRDLGLGPTDLIIALLAVQIVAAPFAVLFGWLAIKFGTKNMIYTGIIIYIIVCIYAMFLSTVVDFWILAMLVATAQGGIQSLSRSYFGQMVPNEKSNEFFGFYNIFGRFAAVTGPFLMGMTTQLTGSSAFGVFSLVILFIIGFIVLLFVSDHKVDAI
ncbi:putative MFS-type transporter YxiO [Paraliobacillus quinghaiensis]|uniref:MFS-type transporter YxiO n=1 Tax=Paraliobacillus quinghaiensis TaxID=470815 RepID=A0A917TLP6_9BACI|nr:MFS transporter [Paraliobacillus quinghaiensis]GGM27987.1 putative MFS-type transporter YxiO [Paraliobacillus quinghaiensis]